MVLVVDHSGSMKQEDRIGGMKRAVATFLEGLPEGSKVAVIAFSSEVELICPFTTDFGRVQESVNALEADGATRYYDAVSAALDLLGGQTGRRAVLALTDGQDAKSLSARRSDRWSPRPAGSGSRSTPWAWATSGRSPSSPSPAWRPRPAVSTTWPATPASSGRSTRRSPAGSGRATAWPTRPTARSPTARSGRSGSRYEKAAQAAETAVFIRGMVVPAAGWSRLFLALLAGLGLLALLPGLLRRRIAGLEGPGGSTRSRIARRVAEPESRGRAMLPPIRYPLPSLLALVILGLLAWKGAEWSRDWRSELAARARRALEGPPVPEFDPAEGGRRADHPPGAPAPRRDARRRAGPDGPTSETIDRRMFVDVYDLWPEPGPVTHVRVGNRKPIGWVPASDVLLWDTRLVLRAPGGRLMMAGSPGGPGRPVEVGTVPVPVLAWEGRSVEVAAWEPGHPWSKVARTGWVRLDDLPPEAWGVWVSQVELPTLLRLAIDGDPPVVRLRAVLGRLADARPLTRADLEAARPALPAVVFEGESDPERSAARLAEANNRPEAEASWAGLNFRFLPMGDLP